MLFFLSMIEDRAQEAARPLVFRPVEDVCGRAALDQSSAIHEDHAVGDLAGKAHFMRDDHHGDAGAGELAHDIEDLADHFRVEGRCRFVEEQDSRLHGERAGDRDALLLTARKLTRKFFRLFGDADAGEQSRALRSASASDVPRTRIGATMTFFKTVMCGKRLKDWKTMPTSALTFPSAGPGSTRMPSTVIRLSGAKASRWLMQRISVDLPEPEGPMTQTTSPSAMSRSMPCRTVKVP